MTRLFSFWTSPVHVRAKDGRTVVVEGPYQAQEMLEGDWPATEGPHFREARELCGLAGTEVGYLGRSRDAFVAALLEAGLLPTRRRAPLKAVARQLRPDFGAVSAV